MQGIAMSSLIAIIVPRTSSSEETSNAGIPVLLSAFAPPTSSFVKFLPAFADKTKAMEEEIRNLKGFIGELRGKNASSFSEVEKEEVNTKIKTPLVTAKKGAEKVMSENYGETLAKRANPVKEV